MPAKKNLCEECNNYLGKKNKLLDTYLCDTCKVLDKYIVTTKTNAKKIYLLNDNDLNELKSYEGSSAYGIATYYTVENLKNKVSSKYNICKDNVKEYLEEMHKEKEIKKEKRKKAKEQKKIQRKEKLIKELSKVKLKLRNDSILCNNYIEGSSAYNLKEIILRMCQMKYLYDYCHMDKCKDIAYQEQQDEIRAGYYPDCSVHDQAEDIALKKYSKGKYPDVFPWLA